MWSNLHRQKYQFEIFLTRPLQLLGRGEPNKKNSSKLRILRIPIWWISQLSFEQIRVSSHLRLKFSINQLPVTNGSTGWKDPYWAVLLQANSTLTYALITAPWSRLYLENSENFCSAASRRWLKQSEQLIPPQRRILFRPEHFKFLFQVKVQNLQIFVQRLRPKANFGSLRLDK